MQKISNFNSFLKYLKLRLDSLSFHEFRQRFVLFPIDGTGRIEVVRGLVSSSVVSRVMAINSSHVKGEGEWPDGVNASVHSRAAERFAKPCAVGTARLVGIAPTTVHKYEPRATRGLPSRTPWQQGFIRCICYR
ncbi:hypothetical protein AVEN_240021-1 [Araneus ventricosus]|uniref:Uncharacterized protein n=1 Tax=Araneus ventricosus TaxID=182803 RepID=A0A4Y2KF01_ARAVE|nr:hypothetical protein AVEN_240021-1 [Araneus ventricosus]